jgi:transcriptional regulator with XRE-family HTH domain
MVHMVNTLGTRLRAARELRSISQAALADQIEIRPHSLWRYEADRARPSIDRLHALSRALNVRMEWLASGDGPMHPSSPPPSREAA